MLTKVIPQSVEPSLTEKQKQLHTVTVQQARAIYSQLVRLQRQSIDNVWNNPRLTPEQALAALGTDAVKLFAGHAAITQLCDTLASISGIESETKHAPREYVEHTDGTITLV